MGNIDRRIMTQPEKVEYILDKGCEFLGLTRADLEPGGIGARSNKWSRKRLLIPVLFDQTILTITDVARTLGYYDTRAISNAHAIIQRDLSDEFYGSQKIKQVYKELLTYLKLNDYENEETDKRKEAVA